MFSEKSSISDGTLEAGHNAKPIIRVDTVHNDEALQIIANHGGEKEWTDDEVNSLRRKVDWKLMPVLCFTYGLQYYDKSMLSQAALFGIQQDLGLAVGDRFSWSSAIFYLGFIAGAYPAAVLAQRLPIERVISGIVTLWGLCLLLTVVCTNYKSLYAQRFFLGALEAGVSPLFMLIVGSWYKKDEQAMRMGIWFSCTGTFAMISPLINYGFGSIDPKASSWKYMYYFAGALTIAWGTLLLFILPADPIRAKGFSKRERYLLVARLRTNNSGVRNKHYKPEQVIELFLDLKFWLIFATAFLLMIANGPVSTFIPTIISGFGFSRLNSLLLVMPAGAVTAILQLTMSYMAGKYSGIRTWLVVMAQLLTTLAALLLWLLPLNARGGLLVGAYFLASFGAGYAVLMGLQIANVAGYTKRSIASSGLYIGFCLGNFVGPLVFKKEDAPRFKPGFIIVVITSLLAAFLAVVYHYVCVWDNRKRDRTGIAEGFDHAYDDDLTDLKNPQFRYVL